MPGGGSNSIFRKESLEKLSSPEQLDQVMHVTRSSAWMALIAIGLVLGLGVLWGIFGRIATQVAGHGILIKSGGVLDISALGSGQITALYVDVGDRVQKGQIVARIAQPDLGQSIEKAKDRLQELVRQHEQIVQLGATDTAVRAGYLGQQRETLQSAARADRDRLVYLKEERAKQAKLAEQGLVTRAAVQSIDSEIQAVQNSIQATESQVRSLSVTSQEQRGAKQRDELTSQSRIREQEREIALLEERMEMTSRVVSPHSGRVLEVRASIGELVGPGRPILNLEPVGSEGSGLEALIYVPLAQGKSVQPGMRVKIAPASIKKEEHGVLLGIVTSVAEFPSTEDGMKRVLQNTMLIQTLLGSVGQAPIAVTAELVPDPRTKTGYRWSSKLGPPAQLGPGTPCEATITVNRTRPIERLIPWVRQTLGG